MKDKIEIDDLKKIELDILIYIDNLFKKNNVEYFLDSGTLLGAIRHKGFIPWDDDIDILVRRRDYKKAINLIHNQDSRYKVLSRYFDKDYLYAFAKVIDSSTRLVEQSTIPIKDLGVYIDIFPLESLPNDENKRRNFQERIYRLGQIAGRAEMWELNQYSNNLKSRLSCFLSNCYGWRHALDKIDDLCLAQSTSESQYVGDLVGSSYKYRQVKASDFESFVMVEFENNLFPAPIGYDDYLRELYGDYMQLPPLDKRVSNHNFVAYRINAN